MSDVTYRLAGPADAAGLSQLGRRTFSETFGHLYDPKDLAAFLENHDPARWSKRLAKRKVAVRVAEAGDELVGYATLGSPSLPFEPAGPAAELRQLYVLEPWQGRGVAATLMDWVIAEARARGADELYLSVFVDNHRARRFYAGYGFEFVGLYAFLVGSHADEDHIMRLSLRAK